MKIEIQDLRVTYCKYFRYLIKNSDIKNVDKFFYLKFNESPSSFRNCLKGMAKDSTYDKVINQLGDYFGYVIPNNKETEEIKCFFENIYKKIYFKYDIEFTDELEQIDKWIREKYIIYPICILYRVFINLSISTRVSYNISKFEKDIQEIKKMEWIYDGILKEIYELLNVSFCNKIPEKYINSNNNSEMMCYLLSSKSVISGNFPLTIYFAEFAKKKFFETSNIKRIIYLNLILILNCNMAGHYNECLNLAEEQLCAIDSISIETNKKVRNVTILNMLIAYTGLKEYKKVLNVLEKKSKLEINELALYIICRHRLKLSINELIETSSPRANKINDLVNNIIDVLDKTKSIKVLKKTILNPAIIKLF